MKKNLFLIAAAIISLASCDKKEADLEGKFDANFNLKTELSELVYAEPVEISGTVSAPVDAVTFLAVKKDGEAYATVGEPQTYEMEGTEVGELFFPDSKEMTDLKVTLSSGKNSADFYFPVAKVTGDKKGNVWMDDLVKLTAAPYMPDGTGEGTKVQSFVSLNGVEINGKLEHILSLDNLRETGGVGTTFGFMNVVRNKDGNNRLYNRGFVIQRAKYWGAESMGRLYDVKEVNGKKFDTSKADAGVKFAIYNGVWKDATNLKRTPEQVEAFKYVDSLFVEIKASKKMTNLDEIRTFYQISEFQKKYDSITLGVDKGTSLKIENTIYRRKNAGASPDAAFEMFRAGDYIIVRNIIDDVPYYALMQVVQMDDDKSVLLEDGSGKIDFAKADQLYGKSIYFDVKAQTILHK